MSTLIYRFIIRAYALAIRIASLFSDKARKWRSGRKGLLESLEKELKALEGQKSEWVWVHASSLGEFEQIRPVLEKLREKDPDIGICLSFFSPSGMEARKGKGDADILTYMPLDLPGKAHRFVNLLQPRVALFVKYELWHEHLQALKEQQIPTLLIAAVFRPEHRYFRWYGGFFRKMLRSFDGIHVQDLRSKELLKGIGIDGCEVSGDPRYDRVWRIASDTDPLKMVERFKGRSFLLVGGSSWPPEEKLLHRYMKEAPEESRLLLAPHDVSEQHLRAIEQRFSDLAPLRYSDDPSDEKLDGCRVLIVDRIGLLARIYQYADAALVGGGFSGALHNVLEPAAHGVPVFFGPDVTDFPEAVDLIVHEAAFALTDAEKLKETLEDAMDDPKGWDRTCKKARHFVEGRRGASDLVMETITPLLKDRERT